MDNAGDKTQLNSGNPTRGEHTPSIEELIQEGERITRRLEAAVEAFYASWARHCGAQR